MNRRISDWSWPIKKVCARKVFPVTFTIEQFRKKMHACFLEAKVVQHPGDIGKGVLRQVDAERFVPNRCPPKVEIGNKNLFKTNT